ncbi:MAG: metalloregulator ArsR/SmtB family transcription factor [Siculibacillus sp.]|nr:metalloregulator ArsR/SmtB family transcription factor [Siculibacillus sp.]
MTVALPPIASLSTDDLVAVLRAGGEPTRLRVLALLEAGDLTVKDLTAILGQSQPRISRHLKLLVEAGLVDRFPEGSWVYYRLRDDGAAAGLVRLVLAALDGEDLAVLRDRERREAVKRGHAEAAGRYFAANASDWAALRSLHVDEREVEAAVLAAVGDRRFGALLDLGTGTARMIELLAGHFDRAVGIDQSHDMLAVARAELDRAGIATARVQQGDVYSLNLPRDAFDLVTVHQVLHYLDDPARALREAARTLRPGGRMLIVDFAPHGLEFLRDAHAHRRLGFGHQEITRALEGAGLEVVSIRDLPAPAGGAGKLTVTLWLARDPRLLVAGDLASESLA